MLFRNGDLGRAVEEAVDGDPPLGTRQRCSGAGVDPVSEGDVLSCVRAVDVEPGGILEHPRVSVARTGDEHQRGAGRDVDTAEPGGDAGKFLAGFIIDDAEKFMRAGKREVGGPLGAGALEITVGGEGFDAIEQALAASSPPE